MGKRKSNYDIIINRRFVLFLIVILLLFSIVIIKISDVMIFKNKEYNKTLLRLNHTEVSGTSSPRGRIYDRNYNIIVDNKSLKTIT